MDATETQQIAAEVRQALEDMGRSQGLPMGLMPRFERMVQALTTPTPEAVARDYDLLDGFVKNEGATSCPMDCACNYCTALARLRDGAARAKVLGDSLANVTGDRDRAIQRIAALESDLAAARQALTEARANLSAEIQRCGDALRERDAARQEVETLRASHEAATQRAVNLAKIGDALRARVATLERERDEAARNWHLSQDRCVTANRRVESAEARVKELERTWVSPERHAAMCERFKAAEARVRAAQDRLTGILKGPDRKDPLELETCVDEVERRLTTPPAPAPLTDPHCVCGTETEPHPLSRHVKTAEGPLRCTVHGCACGPGCIHEGFVDRAGQGGALRPPGWRECTAPRCTGLTFPPEVSECSVCGKSLESTPAPLVEAVGLTEDEVESMRKDVQDGGRLLPVDVLRLMDSHDALTRTRAAHDTARAGSPPPAVVEAVVTTVRQALYQHGLSASLANEAARVVLESLAAHDAAKGGVADAPRISPVERLVDVARRLQHGADGRVVWADLDAAVAAYDASKGGETTRGAPYASVQAHAGPRHPAITHAALAAVVEEWAPLADVAWKAYTEGLPMLPDGERPTNTVNMARAVARDVLRRATGGQVPEVLPKARVVEVLTRRAAQAREAAQRARDMGLPGRRHHSGAHDMAQAIAQDLGLTLGTPPSGPKGIPCRQLCGKAFRDPERRKAHEATCTPPSGPSPLDARCTCTHERGMHQSAAGKCMEAGCACERFTPPSGPGGGVAGDLCPCERAGVDNCGGPCLLPAGPTMATATYHGGPQGEPNEAPVAPVPGGPALAWADLSSQPRPAPHSTCHRDECQEGEPQTCPAFGAREADNTCEHGDHPAPAGQRFCSPECEACEGLEQDAEDNCAGVCGRDPAGEPMTDEQARQVLASAGLTQARVQAGLAKCMDMVREAKESAPEVVWTGDGVLVLADGTCLVFADDGWVDELEDTALALARALAEAKRETDFQRRRADEAAEGMRQRANRALVDAVRNDDDYHAIVEACGDKSRLFIEWVQRLQNAINALEPTP